MESKEDKCGSEDKDTGGGGAGLRAEAKDASTPPPRNYSRHVPTEGQFFEVDVRYQNLKMVGSGAYGMVCAADDELTGSRVAIKKIANVFGNLIDAKRIIREMKLLRHFEHENLIAITDIMFHPPNSRNFDDIYIVTNLMETDLDRVIRSKQGLSEQHYQYLIYQTLRGLKYTHSANVLHRDMKPANLLVNSNCDLRICDFGLARGIVGDEEPGSTQGAALTENVVPRWYRAPELLADCKGYGKALDVWAVGCIMAELLSRTPFFQGRDPRHQLEVIINTLGTPAEEEMDFITTDVVRRAIFAMPHRPKVPLSHYFEGKCAPEGLDLLEKMLRFDPADRITVEDALTHPWLNQLHAENDEPMAPSHFNFDFEAADGGDLSRETLQNLAFDDMTALLAANAAASERPSKKQRK